MTYPESRAAALLEQLETERAISDLVEIALEYWLPLAEKSVLQAAASAPPPDPAGATEHSAQWDYLVDALVLYGLYVIAGNAYDVAYTAMTGVQLAAGRAAAKLLTVDMPGMPTRDTLRERVSTVLSRRMSITLSVVEDRIRTVPQLDTFAGDHVAAVRGRIVDAVNRVWKRTRKAVDEASTKPAAIPAPSGEPAPSAADAARAEVAPVFDPLDPEWRSAVDQAGRSHSTAVINDATTAATDQAIRDTGRKMMVVWTAILDTHTRFTHAKADGQKREPGATFDVGGEQLRYPGDPRASLEETANCRCRLFITFVSPPPPEEPQNPALEASGAPEDFNWIEECGGLPTYIKRISKHLQEKGMTESHAIASAVNSCKKMCDSGDTNFPGRQSVSKMTRAQACNAVQQWEKLKECAAKKRAENAVTHRTATMAADDQETPAMDYRSFTSVLAVIGIPTDDGRMFANDISLSFRDFPLPLLWQKQSAGGHFDAFTVGVIESAGVVGTEVIGKGYMLNTPEADEAAMQIEHGVTGPSVDLGDVEWELRDENGAPITEEDYWDNPDIEMIQTVLSAKVLAATLVATPAFGQTSITMGDAVARGEDALVAAALPMPGVIDVPVYDAALFDNPKFTAPTLPHLTEDGRIQGHLAAFNVCHIGIQDRCVIAPRSQTEYAWFHTAPPVKTDSGAVKVGRLTVGGGHAGPRLNVGATIAHYDNAGTCFALVHVGEDEHGIWFSGVPAPGATAEQIEQGLAAPLSGDWRSVGGNLELVAALAVNTPGFPIIASGATDEHDEPLALVASLSPCVGEDETPASPALDAKEVARLAVEEYVASQKRDADARALISGEVNRQAIAIMEGMD